MASALTTCAVDNHLQVKKPVSRLCERGSRRDFQSFVCHASMHVCALALLRPGALQCRVWPVHLSMSSAASASCQHPYKSCTGSQLALTGQRQVTSVRCLHLLKKHTKSRSPSCIMGQGCRTVGKWLEIRPRTRPSRGDQVLGESASDPRQTTSQVGMTRCTYPLLFLYFL